MIWRWVLLLRASGVDDRGDDGRASIFLVSSFVGSFLPAGVGGDAARAWGLSRVTAHGGEALASVAVDRLLGIAVARRHGRRRAAGVGAGKRRGLAHRRCGRRLARWRAWARFGRIESRVCSAVHRREGRLARRVARRERWRSAAIAADGGVLVHVLALVAGRPTAAHHPGLLAGARPGHCRCHSVTTSSSCRSGC